MQHADRCAVSAAWRLREACVKYEDGTVWLSVPDLSRRRTRGRAIHTCTVSHMSGQCSSKARWNCGAYRPRWQGACTGLDKVLHLM